MADDGFARALAVLASQGAANPAREEAERYVTAAAGDPHVVPALLARLSAHAAAGGALRTSTQPTFNLFLLHLLRASMRRGLTLKVSRAHPISVQVLVLNAPAARRRPPSGTWRRCCSPAT
jgi:hypothetical protein